jgi:dTDP-4-dehydrorhamnose reductase
MTHVDQCQLNQEDCWKQNVTAVEYLVKACESTGAFLLHLSTDFIFDGAAGPYREDDEPNPLSYYAESKLASEGIIKKSSIKWAIARTMLVYGIAHDMSRSNIILWVKENLENHKPIKVVNDQWRMPTLAEDLAIGCKQIIDHGAEGVFHLSGKDMLTPYDIAIKTADFFALDKSLITEVDGSIFTQPAKRPAKTGFVLDKARERINYKPRSFEEGLQLLASQIA